MTSDIIQLYAIFRSASGVSTDTRSVQTGELFFALKGDNFDGNQFAHQALEKGACCVVVDDKNVVDSSQSDKYFLVENVLHTLQQLANYHRKQFDIPFIGITGSNGKTTTKELVRSVLAQKYTTYATAGNLNNHIGVPLTLLRMPLETEVSIIEMGANKVGDIAELCSIAEPSHGLITNIGHAHLEGFGGYEGVLRGKTELYEWLRQSHGTVFINSNDEVLSNMAKRFEANNIVWFGKETDFYSADLLESVPLIVYRDREGYVVQTNIMGAYNFANILVALTLGKFFGLTNTQLNKGIMMYAPQNNRSQIVERTTTQNTLLLDAYNANPDSMQAALRNLEAFKSEKPKVAILGDMLELGEVSLTKHRELLELALQLKIDKILACGKNFERVRNNRYNILHFSTKNELVNYLEQNPIRNSVVLLKGSRGIGLETIQNLL